MKKTILLITDFYYQASGREYFREDIELSAFLRKYFYVCIGHIRDVARVIPAVDAVLIRNSGPQSHHRQELKALRNSPDIIVSNDLCGKGDIQGKQHLLDLFQAGFPVIPSINSYDDIEQLGYCDRYLLKLMDGADSVGIKILSPNEVAQEMNENVVLQPFIEFKYEVSFYFIDRQFHYALYAPNPKKRWDLKVYTATPEDIQFAQKFIDWNTCRSGIQRVDACRLPDGKLLLMELEDYNPYLSLDLLQDNVKQKFLTALCESLSKRIMA
jgi:hypothetical protein